MQETSEGPRIESGRKIRTTRSFKNPRPFRRQEAKSSKARVLDFSEVRLTDVHAEADLHLKWGRHEADVHGGNNELSETKNSGGD